MARLFLPYLAGVGTADEAAACVGAGAGIPGAVGVATGAAGALIAGGAAAGAAGAATASPPWNFTTSGTMSRACLLYTSDAADE